MDMPNSHVTVNYRDPRR